MLEHLLALASLDALDLVLTYNVETSLIVQLLVETGPCSDMLIALHAGVRALRHVLLPEHHTTGAWPLV